MFNYNKYLIISDLDGTLINSKHFISKENLDAISHFTKNGGSFAVATGRTKDNIRPYIKNLVLNGPCILYNGGGIFSFQEERFLATEILDRSAVEEYIIFCMDNYKNMAVEIFTPEMMYIITPDHILDPYVESEKQVFSRTTLEEVMKMDWIKVLLYDSPETLQKAQIKLKDFNLLDKVDSVFSQVFYLELIKKGISKGSALEILKNSHQYGDKIIIAVGDYDNDIEMIRLADVGIAVGNARECVKDAADIVTVSNDENALQEIIYNIIPSLANKQI
ncbi:Cof-type HAD-IIB family hydrolase [Ruminiclostridium josui]|uniref:Cof-type HAD-IIB family hydrolase n=1 Tax=Ruminiclostridium josui TaxID=1499 RepID=UPI000464F8A5|nr:Cof-type HAD-IIB family hydrolase [Ruminiclostridium josui]